MEKTQFEYITSQAKAFAKMVCVGAGTYDNLKKLEERLNAELRPYTNQNKIIFIKIWKEEVDNLFKAHLLKCNDFENCPQHLTSENAAFLVNQYKTEPAFYEKEHNKSLDEFKDKNDLNYYFNASNIPNQDLVFSTYNFFKKENGGEFFDPLDFLNLLNWHYRFLMNNVNLPFDVLSQFKNLKLSDERRQILIGFILKWFGGYPVHNLNTQYNTTLKLLEEEYLTFIGKNYEEQQVITNKLLGGESVDISENERLKQLENQAIFLNLLDKKIANEKERKHLQSLENQINNSLNTVSNKNYVTNKNKLFIFLSHSSKDEKLVKLFTDKILQLSLRINLEDIFCTSIEACSITSGEDFRKFIKENLQQTTYVIQIITDNYKNSEVCLNEMGAAWVMDCKVFPFILNPIHYENVGFIHQPNQLLKLNEKKDILKFIDEIKEGLETAPSLNEVNRHVEDFLFQLNKE